MNPVLEFVITIVVAILTSDVVAFFAAQRYQKKEVKKARLTAFQSLLNEVERIQKVINHNCQLKTDDTIQPVIKMPMVAFETAFVSGEGGLNANEELLQETTSYLAFANSINSFVDIYIALISSGTCTQQLQMGVAGSSYGSYIIQQIVNYSEHKLPTVLEMMKACLQKEIE